MSTDTRSGDVPPADHAPIIDHNPVLVSYYESFASRLGWNVISGNTRHSAYWDADTNWPFPLSAALRRMEHRLFTRLNLPAGSRVLDAGCGDGQIALYIAARGLRVVGIDLVPRHLENSWRNIRRSGLPPGRVEVQYADYHHLEHIPDASFDGVYAMETLMHASDPAAALAGFYRVLRPGGRLVLHESEHPEGMRPMQDERAAANERACMPANVMAAPGFYRRLVEGAGFAAVEQEDLTAHIRPLMRLVYYVALVPYYIVRLLCLERYFVNGVASVRAYREAPWTYLSIGATKPSGEVEDVEVKDE